MTSAEKIHALAPHANAEAVTPSDTEDLPGGDCNALWIGGAGTGGLVVVMKSGKTATFAGVPVGRFDIRVKRVKATGTNVTAIVALY